MKYMEWESRFSMNIPSIDKQHKKLVEMINQLHEVLQPNTEKDVLKAMVDDLSKQASVINGLMNYVVTHFKYEEECLRKHNYPYRKYEKHKKQHEYFTAKVRVYRSHFDKGTAVDANEMMDYLKDWLRKHILKTDKKYVRFLEDKGL